MLSLTDEQIAFIENDIRVRGVTSPDLGIDLLDHICCLIEEKLDEYDNFELVYNETLLLFGQKGLKEIQDETNRLLTFKHYYLMNKTLKISGYVSSLLILSGTFFKFNHWPGANVQMVIGVFFLTVLFLPLLFILKFKSTHESNRSIVLSIIAFVASVMFCAGILFKILHWPYAQILTISGGVLMLLGYLPIYFLNFYKQSTDKLNATATVIFIIAGSALFITQAGGGLPREVSDSFWRGVVDTESLLKTVEKENKNVYAGLVSDTILKKATLKTLQTNTDQLMQYIDNMKYFLIAKAEETSVESAKKMDLDYLRTGGGQEIISPLILDENNSIYSASELKKRIDEYKIYVNHLNLNLDLTCLNTNKFKFYGEEVLWENANFQKLPIPLVVYNLDRMALSVKTIESIALQHLH